MNKFKKVLLVILAAVAVFAISIAAGCSGCNKEEEKKDTLQALKVDASNAKTEYFVGQDFTADGLVVKADIGKSETEISETVTLTASDYTVDSSAYKKDAAGTYSIKVSYTLDEVTLSQSYNVAVTEVKFDGLQVTLAEGVSDTIALSAEATTATIDVSKIVVKDINPVDGTVNNVITDYTVELYKGAEKVTLSDNKATVGGGAYQIWVSKTSEVSDYNRTAFVNIYVIDDLASISLKDGATLTQEEGQNTISSTWNFTAAYESGATKDLTIADVTVEGLETTVAGNNKTATISYAGVNAKGIEITKTITVTYNITAKKPVGGDIAPVNFALNITAETWSYTDDKHALVQSDFTGDMSFLKVVDGATLIFRPEQSKGSIEIKGDALQFTIESAGKLTLECMSTGGSNTSDIAVKDASGNFATCTTAGAVADTDKTGYYTVTGTAATTLEFDLAAGTYTITGCCDSTTGAVHNRNTRIKSIKVATSGGSSASEAYNYSLNITAETWSYTDDKHTLVQSDFADDKSFLTVVDGGTLIFRPGQSKGSIEIKGDALKFTVAGAGKLTIECMSTGGSNTSDIAVKDANGKFVACTSANATADTNKEGYYTVTGTAATTLEFDLEAAGTYTITSCCDSTDGAVHNRNTRIKSIKVAGTGGGSAASSQASASLAITAETWSYTDDKHALVQADFTDDKSFLTVVDGGTLIFRPGQSKGSIEIKGDALQVTFTGTGKLTIECMSTGGSNTSDIAVKDANGNFVTCTSANAVADENETGYYTVTGTGATTLVFDITEAGTYTITSCCDSTDGAVHNRNTRIKSISIGA